MPDGDREGKAEKPENAGDPVIDDHHNADQRQTEQTRVLAAVDGVETERRGRGALLLDRHGILQRVQQRAGEPAGLLFGKFSGDPASTASDASMHLGGRCGKNFVVQHDGEAIDSHAHILREVEELVPGLLVELDADKPALDVVTREGRLDMLARDVGHTMDNEIAFDFLTILLPLHRKNRPGRIEDALFRLDRREQRAALGMHHPEVQFRDLLKLLAHVVELIGCEAGDLHEDAIAARRRDHRLGGAHLIHPVTKHLDRLVERLRGDGPLLPGHGVLGGLDANQKRGAALQVNAERDLAFRDHFPAGLGIDHRIAVGVLHGHVEGRVNIDDRNRRDENRERRAEDAFRALAAGDDVARKQQQQDEAVGESGTG